MLGFVFILTLLGACQSHEPRNADWRWEKLKTTGQPTARHEASFVEHKGQLYLLGGRRVNPVDVFNPRTNTWTVGSPSPIEIHHFQAVSYGDAIYIVGAMTGGYPNEKPLESVIAYYPEEDKFKTLHTIPESRRRGGAGAVVYNNKIYLIGGIQNGHVDGYVPWLDEYDPQTGEWRALPDATFARDHSQAVVVDNTLYTFGGRTSRKRTEQVLELLVKHGEAFDLQKQEWAPVTNALALPTLRAGNMLSSWGNDIVVAGGESHTQLASHSEVEVFDTLSRQWRTWPTPVSARHGTGLAIYDGYLYMASGSANRGGGPELTSVERLKLPDLNDEALASGAAVAEIEIKQQFHTVTLDFIGPELSEMSSPNPFTDYRLTVSFSNGDTVKKVRGFYAADGDAANSGADSGAVWRVRFSPEISGVWQYQATLNQGKGIALTPVSENLIADAVPISNSSGSFEVVESDKEMPDFRANGFIVNDGHYFKFRNSKSHWLKVGANSPENMLGYQEFDATYRHAENDRDGEATAGADLHTFAPHVNDWQLGDPVWMGNKGKGIIGAYNYLASTGMNTSYFLTMNINGDGKDVWPYINHEDFTRFDVSKLAQWNVVFEHMQAKGIMLHMVLQETENERLLDDGNTGEHRQLYFNEMVARFAHHPALVWNIGEENGPTSWSPIAQNDQQRKDMSSFLEAADPYEHPVLLHTHAQAHEKDEIVGPQLGHQALDGLSFQVANRETVNAEVQKWRAFSQQAGKPWLITMDEIGEWMHGAMTDSEDPNHDTLRRYALWGALLGGAAGVEWYFGAHHPATDLSSEDWRMRDRLWTISNHARVFFEEHLPYWEMKPSNHLVDQKGAYVLALSDRVYAIYLPDNKEATIDLSGAQGEFQLSWFDPLNGGGLQSGSVASVRAGELVDLGKAPQEGEKDWVILLSKSLSKLSN